VILGEKVASDLREPCPANAVGHENSAWGCAVTQRSYINSLPKRSIAAMNTFDSSIAELVHKRNMVPGRESGRLLN